MGNNNNIENKDLDKLNEAVFTKGSFSWDKGKDEIWTEMLTKIEAPKQKTSFSLNVKYISIAASLAILLGVSLFMGLYKKNIYANAGIHVQAELPDHSKVILNAGSKLSYRPLLWQFVRKVEMVGEAYFEVEKGEKFQVVTKHGVTEVLGTSFNVHDRNNDFIVTCIKGKVKVSSNRDESVLLLPNVRVRLNEKKSLIVERDIDSQSDISWKNNIFTFDAVPVYKVFNEIERQYNITILANVDNSVLYTGNFTKKQNVETVLGYICPALGLKCTKTGKDTFSITNNE